MRWSSMATNTSAWDRPAAWSIGSGTAGSRKARESFYPSTTAAHANASSGGWSSAAEYGLDVRGFIAPAWLINAAGLRAARDCGFEYTNSYLRFIDLARDRSCFAPSLVFGPGNLNEDLGISLQRRLSRLLACWSVVRVVLHPPCIDQPARFERILSMIRTQMAGHRPVTYLELLSRLRSSEPVAEGDRRAR